MGDRLVCQGRSRGREKVIAHVGEKVQQRGEGFWVQLYLLGQEEQRLASGVDVWVEGVKAEEGRWLYACSGMGRSEMSACTQLGDGRACRAGTHTSFEEGACSRPECRQTRGPVPSSAQYRQAGLPPRLVPGA